MLRPTEEAWQLPEHLRHVVDNELDEGEKLLWLDQPKPAQLARQSIPLVLFGIPWTAFAIFWVWGAAHGTSKADAPGPFKFFPLFCVPFILIGLGMLSSPLWAMRNAKKTAYAITDRRAIIFRGGWGTNIRTFRPDQLRDVHRTQRRDGSGDLVFKETVTYDSDDDAHVTKIGFTGISNVKDVEDIIEALVARHDQEEAVREAAARED